MAILDGLNGYTIAIFMVIVGVVLISRKLTIKMDPMEPPLLPSRIPYVGHLINLLRHQIDYYQMFKDTPLPAFTMNLLSAKVYIIKSPALIQAAIRSKSLTFDPFITNFADKPMQMSKSALDIMLEDPEDEKTPTYLREVHKAMHESMQPGAGLLDMNKRVLDRLGEDINAVGGAWEERPLFMWLRNMFTVAAARALYGPRNVIEKDPSLIQQLWAFDKDQLWLIIDVFPTLLAPDAFKARAALQAAFKTYYDDGHDRDAGALVAARNAAARKFNITNDDLAQSELSILFVTTTNAVPTAFWLLIHILSDPQLLYEIQEELQAIIQFSTSEAGEKEGLIDISKFTTHTPLLHSTYHEAMRLSNAQVSARQVKTDTVLTDPSTGIQILLKKGSVAQMPSGIPHNSTAVWGADAERFDARRFLKRDTLVGKEKKTQTQGFLPFGGGKHLCPGRYFALAEILGMVAVLVLGFEFGSGIQLPEGARQQFGEGVRKPASDPNVKIRRRQGLENVRWRFLVGEEGGNSETKVHTEY